MKCENVKWTVAVVFLFLSPLLIAKCPIVPEPKQYVERAEQFELRGAAIVLGNHADQVDMYAAERLGYYIQKRFSCDTAVVDENDTARYDTLIVLGQTSTNGLLKKLCTEKGFELSADHPGFDGYIIEVFRDNNRTLVILGGSNARGVTYAMNSFFDLLRMQDGRVVFNAVSVRDFPSIAWRGRNCAREVSEEAYDAYVRGRVNFVDTLYPMVGHGKKGFGIDTDRINGVLEQAHRRGLFVYGVVNCAVKPEDFSRVVTSFETLIDMGVDGIWLSFDDAGEGLYSERLIQDTLAMAQRKGLSSNQIVMTPPAGSYHNIMTPWNKAMAGQEGFDEIHWFFTRIPCDCDVQDARKIGLDSTQPAWWHNWPRYSSGLLNGAYGVNLFSRTPYFELTPLETGWHMPTYPEIAQADRYTDVGVICAGGAEEYIMPTWGWWAWDPAKHDWQNTRMHIYTDVFGPAAASAAAFDDEFVKLKNMFTGIRYKRMSPEYWPVKLKDVADRGRALSAVESMEKHLKAIREKSPSLSLLDASSLAARYFAPMQDAVDYGRAMVTLDYPDYRYPDFSADMIKRVKADPEKAAAYLAKIRPEIEAQLAVIAEKLKGVSGVEDYVNYWKTRINGTEYWTDKIVGKSRGQARQSKVRKQLAASFAGFAKGQYDHLLKNQGRSGRCAEARVLKEIPAKALFEGSVDCTGDGWKVGLYNPDTAVIAFDGSTCAKDDNAKIVYSLEIPEYTGKLKMEIFVTQSAEFDNLAEIREERIHVIALNNKWLWVQDGANRMDDCEWVTLDLVASDDGLVLPGERFDLTFLVYGNQQTQNYKSAFLFGPARIIEEPLR